MDISSDSNDKKSRNQYFDWSNIWPLPDKSGHFYTDWEPMWFLCQSDQKISAPASHRFLLIWWTIVYTRNTPEIMHFTSYNVLTFVLLGALAKKLGLPLPWCCRRRPHDDKVCHRRSTVCLQNVNFLIPAREMFLYPAQRFSPLLRILNSGWNSLNPFHNACKGPNPSVYIESDFDALMWLCRAWIYWIEPALHGGQTFAMSFTTMRCFMITFGPFGRIEEEN